MDNSNLRLEGVYNDQSFQIANENQVKTLTLDFRPRSFNFLPVHHALELLEKWKDHFQDFRLLFSSDSELIVSEIFSKLSHQIGSKCSIEFEFYREDFNYQSLDLPFYLEVEELDILERAILLPNLKGLVLDTEFLLGLAEEGVYEEYLNFIHRLILSNQRKDLVIDLRIDWDGVFPHNLNKWFHINQFILSVSPVVEEKYRVINPDLFLSKFKNVQNHIVGPEGRR